MGVPGPPRDRTRGEAPSSQPPTELELTESTEKSQICAVVVTYNIGNAIHRCFNSIQGQVAHVLIIDNGSGDDTRRELRQLADSDSATVILNERNEGIAHAYNQAVCWARKKGFQWILTLDHDSEATPGMIDELERGYDALQSAGIRNIGIIAANPFDLNIGQYLYFPPREHGGLPVFGGEVISSGSLILLEVFDVVGLFNEDLFIYFVDVEICQRLSRSGYGVYICPEAVFLHQEGLKKKHRFLWIDAWYDHYGPSARYYIARNTIYLLKRLRPGRSEWRALVHRLWNDHLNIILFDKQRLSILWFSLKGFVDGLRGKVGPMDSRDTVNAEFKII